MALIRCCGLHKHYHLGGELIRALDGVDLDVDDGEYVAVMGPSGSGKSTLMNLVGALDVPTSGRLEIAGANIADLDSDGLAALRNDVIGFVFQQFNLLPRSTALKNVRLPLLYAGSHIDDWEDRCRAALTRVGLADRMQHLPRELSGGQQQRVAIARALVNQPRLLLADEPTGALDSRTTEEILELFGELNGQGVTIVVVTHEADVAAHARRRLHFLDGQLVRDEREATAASASATAAILETQP